MKKIIKIIFLIISMLSFFILFNDSKIDSIDNIKNIERHLENTYKILMPNEVTSKNQKSIYNGLKETLDQYEGNIYYSKVENSDNKEKDIKYIYLSDFKYFDLLKIDDGRGFNLYEKEDKLFLSTKNTSSGDQIGRIASLDKKYDYEIHTLNTLVEKGLLLDGYCYVQIKNNKDIDRFINDLEKNTDIVGIKIVKEDMSIGHTLPTEWIIILGLYFLAMLTILYYILKSYKKIAVKKMTGFSNKTIYFTEIKNLLLSQIIIQALVTIVLGIINFNVYNYYVSEFLRDLFLVYIVESLILFVIASLPYMYLNKIKISNMIKNKQPTKEILIFNTLIKSLLIVGLFIVLKCTLTDLDSFKNIYAKSFENWDRTEDYGVIPATYDMPYEELLNGENSDKFYSDQKNIYKYFNENGAVLADFSSFIDEDREFILGERTKIYESDNINVNPNYLVENPIYDIYGNKVSISDDVADTIILVPEQYKNYENEIIEFRKFWNSGYREGGKRISSEIKIIWIKSGQELFSYNLDVNIKNGNIIKDAFINVLTEANGDDAEYNIIMAYKGNPFMIKLDNSISVEDNILPKLTELGYAQYAYNISRVSDVTAYESKSIKDKMYLYLVNTILVGCALVLVILQNVVNYFNQYKQQLAIRHLHGYSIWDKYKEYFILILLSWILIFAGVKVLNIIEVSFQVKISMILISLEIIISLIFLLIENRKNITNTIKGS